VACCSMSSGPSRMALRKSAIKVCRPVMLRSCGPISLHHVMAVCSKTGQAVVLVVDRSGSHRAHKLDTTLDHYDGQWRFHFFPAPGGPHLNPMEGFWRVMQGAIGAGRCLGNLHLLYQRTRQVLMGHHERPISEFHW
jgi:DDE superfamily endonuclease